MTNKESTKTPSPVRKKRRRKIAHGHESERFAPCAFALEKYLIVYPRKERSLRAWQRIKPD
ncbi:hypothetical protein [Escherichia coli]|uniref:hypothetical protein n=1 Tax=Escherichia coli TaxID=562 RepID=UPI001FCF156A|nr:hypothetical protein [Escherichia coli]